MINAAIVGLGGWGRNLVNHTQGKSPKIRFVAGCVRSVEKARAFGAEKGFPIGSDYAALLAEREIDAVVLATPHSAHAEQVVQAARAGKHVFCEKPFTLSRASAEQSIRACAEHKVTLMVGYNWRHQPALQEVVRMIADGRLGKVLHVEGNFNGPSVYRYAKDHWRPSREECPAGGMTGRGCHVVDAMINVAGHIDSVYAMSKRQVLDSGLDDTTSMLFTFKSGATGYLGTVIATAECWRLQVFGSKGWAEMGSVPHLTTWTLRRCYLEQPMEFVEFPGVSTERAELEAFADAIEAGRPLVNDAADLLNNSAVLDAIVGSVDTARRVEIA
ncbi:MAG: gfo/Idh/MocA family oxidoreductase [Betaproteobacteria bacterium]|nr:MAG: gfo/Idh/MocA family oxidoreductase [Betaproteobacteria bacterium]